MFDFKEMDRRSAKKIAEWKYGEEYSYCDFNGWEKEKKELASGLYFAAFKEGILSGFICFGQAAQWPDESLEEIYKDESYTDIAMGLAPELCGLGLGQQFLKDCMCFARKFFPDDGIRVSVDARNIRAEKLYIKEGFTLVRRVTFTYREDIKIYTFDF